MTEEQGKQFADAIVCFCWWKCYSTTGGGKRLEQHLKETFQCGRLENMATIWRTYPYTNPFGWEWTAKNILVYEYDLRHPEERELWEKFVSKKGVDPWPATLKL